MQIYHISAVQIGSGRSALLQYPVFCCFGRFVMLRFMFLRRFALDFSGIQRGINAGFRNKIFCALRIVPLQGGPECDGSPHSDLNRKARGNNGCLHLGNTSHPERPPKKKTTPLMFVCYFWFILLNFVKFLQKSQKYYQICNYSPKIALFLAENHKIIPEMIHF